MSERIEPQGPQDEGLETSGLTPAPPPKQKKSLDPGAKKNLMIIGGAVGAATLVMGGMFVMMSAPPQVAEGNLPGTVIQTGVGGAQREQVTALSPEEMARLDRVTGREADAAAEQGRTFVPGEIPIVIDQTAAFQQQQMLQMPPPPGVNYHPGMGTQTQGPSQQEIDRMQRIMQGFEGQLSRIASMNAVPQMGSAPRYEMPEDRTQRTAAGAGSSTSQPPAPSATATNAQAQTLVSALSISAAETLTVINTERTSFVSARIVAGPAAGATLYGTSEMVADQGVRVIFNRMLLDGRSHTINAIALDPTESHDLLNANVDRKLFERYVLPILGSIGGAYFTARGQQAQRVVMGSGGDVVAVEQTAPSSREAVAQALAAGMATTVQQIAAQPTQPSATLPAGASVGVLFLDPVVASGSQAVPAPLRSAPGVSFGAPTGIMQAVSQR